jgi:hypothetical protein
MRAALATTALLLQAACTAAAPFTGTAPVVPGTAIKAGNFDTVRYSSSWYTPNALLIRYTIIQQERTTPAVRSS